MNRLEKNELVQELQSQFLGNDAAFLVNYQGLTVDQLETLRFALAAKNSSLKVAKNRLVRIALQQANACDGLQDSLKGQLAVVFAKDDLTGVAKVIFDFAKKNDALKIVAACGDKQLFDAKAVERLAKIPSREVLLAQLCGVLNAPITSLAIVLDQIQKQKSSENN